MIRAILFDFNGVLVDDEPIHFELFAEVLAEEGLTLTESAYRERYLGFDDRGCFEAVYRDQGREVPAHFDMMRLVARKASYYRERVGREGFPYFAGAMDWVQGAAGRGLRLGIVSGALRDEVELALVQADLADHFQCIVAAEDVEHSKPDPEGYRVGLERLNSSSPLPSRLFHPHEVLAIEDTPAGLESAAAAGLSTLGVAQTYEAEALHADQVISSLVDGDLGVVLEEFSS